MTTVRLLVTAKAPTPGLVKTRLAATVGNDRAADLAALALLDTIEACTATGLDCHLALAGDLSQATHAAELRRSLKHWQVFAQPHGTFGERLAHAHQWVGGPLLQIGMDTPQVNAGDLMAAALLLRIHDAVLGPASDGGWWLLGLQDASVAACLIDVPMSRATTGADTLAALRSAGGDVVLTRELEDVDTCAEAERVALAAPGTRFGQAWLAGESTARTQLPRTPLTGARR